MEFSKSPSKYIYQLAVMTAITASTIAVSAAVISYQERMKAEVESQHFHFEQQYQNVEKPKEALVNHQLKGLETLLI